MIKKSLPLIFLTLSCKTIPKEFPREPFYTMKQPIIEQEFCEDVGGDRVCAVKSLCREYAKNVEGKWIHVEDHELKYCHGALGVNAKEYNDIRNFVRRVEQWIKDNVKN